MGIPKLYRAIHGWTKKTQCKIVTTQTVQFREVETTVDAIFDLMITTMAPEKINRKTEEERSWQWVHLLIKGFKDPKIKKHDKIITATGRTFRIEAINQWPDTGLFYYEAIEDYTEPDPDPETED